MKKTFYIIFSLCLTFSFFVNFKSVKASSCLQKASCFLAGKAGDGAESCIQGTRECSISCPSGNYCVGHDSSTARVCAGGNICSTFYETCECLPSPPPPTPPPPTPTPPPCSPPRPPSLGPCEHETARSGPSIRKAWTRGRGP